MVSREMWFTMVKRFEFNRILWLFRSLFIFTPPKSAHFHMLDFQDIKRFVWTFRKSIIQFGSFAMLILWNEWRWLDSLLKLMLLFSFSMQPLVLSSPAIWLNTEMTSELSMKSMDITTQLKTRVRILHLKLKEFYLQEFQQNSLVMKIFGLLQLLLIPQWISILRNLHLP